MLPDPDEDFALKLQEEPEPDPPEAEAPEPYNHDDPPPPEPEAVPEPEPEPAKRKELSRAEQLQQRIGKLTRLKHEAERNAAAALARAEAAEARAAAALAQAGESGKINEQLFGERLDQHLALAEREVGEAYEAGDKAAVAAAQRKLAELAAIRAQHQANTRRPVVEPKTPEPEPQPQQSAPYTPAQLAKAHAWRTQNAGWYETNPEMQRVADAEAMAILNEGYDPAENEFYQELNARLAQKLRPAAQKPAARAAVAPAGRISAPARPSTVRLEKWQVDKAASLGLSPADYLRYASGVHE